MDTYYLLAQADTATATQSGGAVVPVASDTNTTTVVESPTTPTKNSDNEGAFANIIIGGCFITIILIFAAALFVVYRIFAEQKKELISKIGELNQTSQELYHKMKKLEKENNQLNNQLIEIKKQYDNVRMKKDEKTSGPAKSIGSQQSGDNVIKSAAPKESTIRYGIFAVGESTETLTIENRDLSEDPTAWFKFDVSAGDKATYTINQNCVGEMLGDLEQLKLFTEKFVIPNSPSRVEEVNKGILTKNGREWVVQKRLEVRVV